MQKKVKVSIIIVFYSRSKDLFDCIESIKKALPKISYEIIVINNSTKKNLATKIKDNFSDIKYFDSLKNFGYGAGNNLGASYAKGECLLILNPDTEIASGNIESLVKILDKNKNAAIVAPSLIDGKGFEYQQLDYHELTPIKGVLKLSFLNNFLKNKSKKHESGGELIEVDKVHGSVFLIKSEVFKQIGKFDENIFLYFEEDDLCRRVKKAGYKIYIDTETKVLHKWVGRKSKSSSLKKTFGESRFYYFKKHYGNFAAIVVEAFARFSKWNAMFIAILIIGSILRFYKSGSIFIFNSEIGQNLLDIKNYVISKSIPLIGPPTSHPWLNFGPLFYWLYIPFLILSKYNPLSHLYFGVVISILVIVVNFYAIRYIFNTAVATISTFLIAISPLYIQFGQEARFYSMTLLFIYLFLVIFYKYIRTNNIKYIFWSFFAISLLFNFHYSPIFLIPPLIFTIYRKKILFKFKILFYCFTGLIIPLIPIVLYSIINMNNMLIKLLMWIPYRFSGFVGFYPKNQSSLEILKGSTQVLFNVINKLFFPVNNMIIGIVLTSIIVIYIFWKFINSYRGKFHTGIYEFVIILLVGVMSLFIHGNPPIHYYLPLMPVIIVIFSLFVNDLVVKLKNIKFLMIILTLLLASNVFYILNQRNNLSKINFVLDNPYYIPQKLKLDVIKYIIRDANGQKYSLTRSGKYDQFDKNFAEDYEYLLWLNGNEPVEVGGKSVSKYQPKIEYTIVEEPKDINIKDNSYHWFNNILLIRKNLQ